MLSILISCAPPRWGSGVHGSCYMEHRRTLRRSNTMLTRTLLHCLATCWASDSHARRRFYLRLLSPLANSSWIFWPFAVERFGLWVIKGVVALLSNSFEVSRCSLGSVSAKVTDLSLLLHEGLLPELRKVHPLTLILHQQMMQRCQCLYVVVTKTWLWTQRFAIGLERSLVERGRARLLETNGEKRSPSHNYCTHFLLFWEWYSLKSA